MGAVQPVRRRLRRPRRILILVGGKLIGLDSVLPVAMAIKAEDPSIDVVFLFLDGGAWPVVARNYVLRRGIEDTGRVAMLATASKGPVRKAVAGLRLIRWCLGAFVRRTWIFCYSDAAAFPVRPLSTMARRGGGSVLLYAKAAHPGSNALRFAHRSKETRKGKNVTFADPGDLFLLYHPSQHQDYSDFVEGPTAVIGSPRSYPEWRAHMGRLFEQIGIRDGQDRTVDVIGNPRFALFYSGDVEIPTQMDSPRESLRRTLIAISEESPGAVVLIKPHPNCDLDQLDRDVAGFSDLDLHVTHAHPQVLARLATAAIFNNGSNAMNDVYAEGTPIIETSVYSPEIRALDVSLFANPGRIDGSTDEGLRRAIRLATEKPGDLPEPDSALLVWPKPDSLLDTLCSQ